MKRKNVNSFAILLATICLSSVSLQAQDFHFDSTISQKVLGNYLSRSISYTELLHDDLSQAHDKRGVDPRDNIRMLLNCGAKYIGRSIMLWGTESNLQAYLKNGKRIIDTMHSVDPDIIFGAAEFEYVSSNVGSIAVPAYVFQEFGSPVVTRNFRLADIIHTDGQLRGGLPNVPDMSRLEARMWFYFLAVSYIDIGVEAIHFGQVGLMADNDPGYTNWIDMLTRVRAYARAHARRHLVLCDAHTHPSSNYVVNGKLLFDVHAFPLRIAQSGTTCCKAELRVGYMDALFTKSKGGITPSGWSCTHLPWLGEFDNFGGSNPGTSSSGTIFIWGWDEITWIARLAEADRNAWLRYAWNWVAANDSACHLQMPGSRILTNGPANSPGWYWSNTKSSACPNGFNAEDTIKAIWGPIQNTAIQPAHQAGTKSGYTRHGRWNGSLFLLSGRLVKTFSGEAEFAQSAKPEYFLPKLNKGVYIYLISLPSGNLLKGKIAIDK
jgi:hypothetical protein